jgi:hypothetical protein
MGIGGFAGHHRCLAVCQHALKEQRQHALIGWHSVDSRLKCRCCDVTCEAGMTVSIVGTARPMDACLLFIIKATDLQDVYKDVPNQDLSGVAEYHVQCAVVL